MSVRNTIFIFAAMKIVGVTSNAWGYEHSEFQGEWVYFSNDVDGECYNFAQDWKNRISSLDTGGHCIEVYSRWMCRGHGTVLAPGTPSHNDLTEIRIDNGILGSAADWDGRNWNDEIQSYRYCDDALGSFFITATHPGGLEWKFWSYLFRYYDSGMLREFESRTRKSAFIWWDFFIGGYGGNMGIEYTVALLDVRHLAHATIANWGEGQRRELLRLANQVVYKRFLQLDDRTPSYRAHLRIFKLWEAISDALKRIL